MNFFFFTLYFRENHIFIERNYSRLSNKIVISNDLFLQILSLPPPSPISTSFWILQLCRISVNNVNIFLRLIFQLLVREVFCWLWLYESNVNSITWFPFFFPPYTTFRCQQTMGHVYLGYVIYGSFAALFIHFYINAYYLSPRSKHKKAE